MELSTIEHPLSRRIWWAEEAAFVAGEQWAPIQGADAIVHPQLPEVWDASFVSRVSPTADPRTLLEEARRHLIRNGCAHVKILLHDPATFDSVGVGLSRRGMFRRTYVTLCTDSVPPKQVTRGVVRVRAVRSKQDRATLAAVRRAVREEAPWYTHDVSMALDAWADLESATLDLVWLTAFLDDVPAGAAGLLVTDHGASLQSLATVPSLRQRGVGGALVREIISRGLARGSPFVCLLTDAREGPRHFYEGLGFQEAGRIQEYLQAMC